MCLLFFIRYTSLHNSQCHIIKEEMRTFQTKFSRKQPYFEKHKNIYFVSSEEKVLKWQEDLDSAVRNTIFVSNNNGSDFEVRQVFRKQSPFIHIHEIFVKRSFFKKGWLGYHKWTESKTLRFYLKEDMSLFSFDDLIGHKSKQVSNMFQKEKITPKGFDLKRLDYGEKELPFTYNNGMVISNHFRIPIVKLYPFLDDTYLPKEQLSAFKTTNKKFQVPSYRVYCPDF